MDTIWLVLLVLLVVGLICACYYFWPHIKNFFGGRNLKRTKKRKNKKKHSRELSSERNSKFESGSCKTSAQDSDTPPKKKTRKDSRARAVSTEPNRSSQETSPLRTSSQETTKKGTTTKGTSSKRTTSQGTTSQGTTSQGTTSQGASSKGRTSKGTTTKGSTTNETTQPRTTVGGFSQGSTEATPNPFQYYNNRYPPPPPPSYPNPPPKKKTRKDSRARAVSTEPNGSSQGTSPLRTSSQGTTSQGTTNKGTTTKGTSSKRTTSQGTTSQGTTSQGTTSQGASSKGRTWKETTSQGTTSQGVSSLGTTTQGTTTKGSTTKGTTTNGSTTNGTTQPRTTVGGFSQGSTEATPNPFQYYNNRYPPPPPSYPNNYLDPYNLYQQSPMHYPDRYPNYYPTRAQPTSPRQLYNSRPLYSPPVNKPTNYRTSTTIDPRTQWNGQLFPTRTTQPNANQWGTNEQRIQTDQKKSKNFLQKAYKYKNPFKWFKKGKKGKYPQPEVPENPTYPTYVSTNNQPTPPAADTRKKRGFFGLFKRKKKDPPMVYQTNPENTHVKTNQTEPKKKKKWWKWNRKKKIPINQNPPPQESKDILMTNTNQCIKRPKVKGNYQVGEIPAFRKQAKKDNNKLGTTVKSSPKVSREDKEKKPYTEYGQETPVPSAPEVPFNESPQESQSPSDFQAFEPQVLEPQVLPTPEQMAHLGRLFDNGNHYEENPFQFIGPLTPTGNVRFNCPCAECTNYGLMLKHNIFDVPICPQHLFHTDKSCVNCKTFYRKLTSGFAVKSINVPKNKNCENICAVHQTQACLAHDYRRKPAECAVCSGLEAQMRAGLRCTCFMMCLSCFVLYKNHHHNKVICCLACSRLGANTDPEKDNLLCRAHNHHIDPENCGECEEYWKKSGIGKFDYKLFMDEIEIPQLDFQDSFGML